MKLKTSDGVDIFYETYGNDEGYPLFLIHGLGAEHRMWDPQISKYPSKGYRLIVPDLRGHGESSNVGTFRIGDCARDIKELSDKLGLEKFSLAGVSLGGAVVQQFACDHRDKVDKLVIADSFSSVSTLTQMAAGWMQWLTMKITPDLLERSLKQVYKGPEREKALQYFLESYKKSDNEQLLMARAEINRFDITNRLEKVDAPTLVIVGDGFGKFAIKMARKTVDLIKNSQFRILKHGCDPSNLVVPEHFDNVVLDFLKEQA